MNHRALLAVLALSLGASCRDGAGSAPTRARLPPQVSVARITTADVSVTVDAPVDLRPLSSAEVGSKTLGYLDAVLVERGDKIRKGQLLALVRPSETPSQIAVAKGDLARQQAAADLARTSFDRVRALIPNAAASQQELQQAASTLAASEAAREAVEAQIAGLAAKLGETRITAPMDGFVAWRRLDAGALVGPATGAILTVVRTDVLRVFIPVNERHLRGVSVGKEALLRFDAMPGQRYAGKVVRMSPALDPATRTVEAEVQLRNDNGDLRPGLYGRASIITETHPLVPVVPVAAVTRSNDAVWVFVVQADVAHRRKIVLGVQGEDCFEVTSGLKAGEEIVIAGIESLADGTKVRTSRGMDPFAGRTDAGAATTIAQPAPVRAPSLPR